VTWTAGASVFSGRPDPTWEVDEALGERLAELWADLEPTAHAPPAAPPLGYRGVFLRDPSGREWHAAEGVVTLENERRLDPDRRFEGELLASAPPGVVPPVEMNR
jgi:hypothetical protein